MTRPRLTAEERRRQITVAAVEVFAAHGYAAASTDAIARRVGVSQPYVVRLFSSKAALFAAAAEHVFDKIEQRLANLSSQSSASSAAASFENCRGLLDDETVTRFLVQLYSYACVDDDIQQVASEGFARQSVLLLDLFGGDESKVNALLGEMLVRAIGARAHVP
ncbi:TetR/AcrR family transcriptional regulator [Nocardia tengchongensis]|uniref:TetR/AcrR family transcriptional regulator n=1 Tax=Nocardia tengchongensis TaxID=2055889 RepID=UPI00368F3747